MVSKAGEVVRSLWLTGVALMLIYKREERSSMARRLSWNLKVASPRQDRTAKSEMIPGSYMDCRLMRMAERLSQLERNHASIRALHRKCQTERFERTAGCPTVLLPPMSSAASLSVLGQQRSLRQSLI